MSDYDIELIDRYELLNVLMRNDCSTREKIFDLVCGQKTIAFARKRIEIEVAETGSA